MNGGAEFASETEEEEVVTYLNSVQCSCGKRFSIAHKTSKERQNIRSGHTTARCPDGITKLELERNEMTCQCGITFSIEHLTKYPEREGQSTQRAHHSEVSELRGRTRNQRKKTLRIQMRRL